jgi:hypothetical protein
MRRLTLILITLAILSVGIIIPAGFAQEEREVVLHLLQRDDCKHCEDEKVFLEKLLQEDKNIIVESHYANGDGKELFTQITKSAGLPKVTPVTFIEGFIIQGFDTEETTGEQIKDIIAEVRGKELLTLEDFLKNPQPKSIFDTKAFCEEETGVCSAERPVFNISIPFIGKTINLFDYSLPTLSVILGFVDGFNPCAMWVLVIFLTVLIDAGSRKRMWQLAGLFIVAEAIMYYLILNVWFTAWDFVGLDAIITPVVGAVAVGAGLFFLNEWRKGDTSCKVGNAESKKRTVNRIKKLATAEFTIATIVGAIFLAFSVNIIEFACSIGIPQAFTKVIELNPITFLHKQFLMLLYIIMYMIDDLIIFGIALYSFEKIGITTKYTHYSHFIGGLLMLILGVLLIFFPEALVFF